MGIAEMQQQFNAYGSGQLPEFELRTFIRRALRHEPQLSSAFIALTDAYRRANLIDAKLQSTINADIAEVTAPLTALTMVRPVESTSPMMALTRVRPPVPERSNTGWISDVRAANSTDVNTGPGLATGPGTAMGRTAPTGPPHLGAAGSLPMGAVGSLTTGPGGSPTTGSTGGSTWDVGDGLAEVGAPLYPGAVIRDRFVLIDELGRGGMGVVYKAYDRSRGDMKDRYVAIKVLSEEFKRHPLAVRALQREARKAQKLAHPNVVAVYDFDRDGGNVYMVMEYLSGRSLDQVLREDGQGGIPLGPAMEIIKCLAAALSYAHQHEIVHCDFKPSNAFLSDEGKVKVLDFGIARAAPSLSEKGDTTMFDAGQLGAISPAYASFELLQREQPDVRDDVYSFACVAYELLTGCHPYQRLDAVRAYQAGLQPRPVRKLTRGQWRALKQGLAFRRIDRYPTIDALARALIVPNRGTRTWVMAAAAGAAAAALAGIAIWKLPDVRPSVTQSSPGRDSQAASGTAKERATTAESAASTAPVETPAVESPIATRKQPTTVVTSQLPESATGAGSGPTAGPPGYSRQGAAGHGPSESSIALPPSTASAPSEQPSNAQTQPGEERKRAAVEMLREQFETQAAAGDIPGATTTGRTLARASPGSPYVEHELPRILTLAYIHLAKTQFAGGQVSAALQTIDDGRKKFVKSTELKDLEARYVTAANVYDRLSTAVVINVNDMKSSLEELKASEGDEYDTAAQMLAQTLADRIADERAANRDTVADKLLDSGKQLFPSYIGILGHGTAGVLQNVPLPVSSE